MLEGAAKLTSLNIIQPGIPAPLVNVVFLHGLNENWFKSWGFNEPRSWKDYLREACPEANLWSVDYQVHWSEYGGGSMSLYQRALNVLGTIRLQLDDGLPVILLGHSYGGCLIKQMLKTGAETSEYEAFVDKVKGIGLFAVPNSGSDLADFAEKLAAIGRTSKAIGNLKRNNEALIELSPWFRNNVVRRDWKVVVFHETKLTPPGVLVVDESSSDPGIVNVSSHGVDGNHNEAQLPGNDEGDIRVQLITELVTKVAYAGGKVQPVVEPRELWALSGDALDQDIAATAAREQTDHSPTLLWRLKYLKQAKKAETLAVTALEPARIPWWRKLLARPAHLVAALLLLVAIALAGSLTFIGFQPLSGPSIEACDNKWLSDDDYTTCYNFLWKQYRPVTLDGRVSWLGFGRDEYKADWVLAIHDGCWWTLRAVPRDKVDQENEKLRPLGFTRTWYQTFTDKSGSEQVQALWWLATTQPCPKIPK